MQIFYYRSQIMSFFVIEIELLTYINGSGVCNRLVAGGAGSGSAWWHWLWLGALAGGTGSGLRRWL
jgi:hypothetical protein